MVHINAVRVEAVRAPRSFHVAGRCDRCGQINECLAYFPAGLCLYRPTRGHDGVWLCERCDARWNDDTWADTHQAAWANHQALAVQYAAARRAAHDWVEYCKEYGPSPLVEAYPHYVQLQTLKRRLEAVPPDDPLRGLLEEATSRFNEAARARKGAQP